MNAVTDQQAQHTDNTSVADTGQHDAAQTDAVQAIVPPGERLRQAREARKLSVEDVATQLKLDSGKITALERGEVGRIVAPVFVAGYLRAYAKLLELPAEELIADFDALRNMDSPSMDPTAGPAAQNYGKVKGALGSSMPTGEDHGWLQMGAWAVMVAVVVVAVYWLWPGSSEQQIASLDTAPMAGGVEQAEVPAPAFDAPQMANSPVQEPMATTAQESAEVSTPEIPPAQTEPAAQTEPVMQSHQPESQLSLYFNEDSWTEVYDATGHRLMYRLGKSGMAHDLSGVAPFDVRLGYVPGVSVMFNGETYDMSRFAGRRSARFRVGTIGDNAGQRSVAAQTDTQGNSQNNAQNNAQGTVTDNSGNSAAGAATEPQVSAEAETDPQAATLPVGTDDD